MPYFFAIGQIICKGLSKPVVVSWYTHARWVYFFDANTASSFSKSIGSYVELLYTSIGILYTCAIFAIRAPYEPLSITNSFPVSGTQEETMTSSAPVPEHPNITVSYSSGLVWGASANSFISSQSHCIKFPNSFSRGQISAATWAYLTLSVVVAGPGLRSTSRRTLRRLSFSSIWG